MTPAEEKAARKWVFLRKKDADQIWALVDALRKASREWMEITEIPQNWPDLPPDREDRDVFKWRFELMKQRAEALKELLKE